jgi:two-component sensor histidine kinase/CHASE3 domain sensor protein
MTQGEPPRERRSRGARPGLASLLLFVIVAGALLFATMLIFDTTRAERAQRAQLSRTSAVMDTLNEVNAAAVNAETGQRGYLITLDRRYLAPYQLGAAAYPQAMRRLHALVDGEESERQRALLRRAEELADAKFAEMAETIALIDERRVIDAQQAVMTDEGQKLMVELRATLAELEAIELRVLDRASQRAAKLEARMLPLLGGLLALIVLALGLGLWLVARAARAEAAAQQAGALAEARDRADLLARELNHRVKNLFAVVLAIVRMSGKGQPEAKPVVAKITERIHALVSAHDLTQGASGRQAADLRALIDATVAPYRTDGNRCEIDGPAVAIESNEAVALGLVLHELATNAVKYGAWSGNDGILTVRWGREDGRVRLIWREEGEAELAAAPAMGFGSQLMESSARQLGGSIERRFHPRGVEVVMDVPIGD